MREVPGLPTGTLTLLFTDTEGSTRLLTDLGPRYADVVSRQRAILRDCFARHHGRELGTEGDSFFVVFRSAVEAVAAAVDGQQGLIAEPWPDNARVLVRMGLHTGEPTPHEDSYVGMDVHRAARIAGSAHGGQVVVSESTYGLVATQPGPGVGFEDLGMHRLKDLPAPERLHQVTAPGLPTRFLPLRSLGSGTNLPRPATSFVGRKEELDELRHLVAEADARLVTLTGPAGTGKTRLAIAVAAALEGSFPDGVYFVPLASVSSADVMWTSIADVLGVTGESKAPPTFLEYLARRRLFLVLDNLEQLPDAPSVVSELLSAAPDLQVLATSRRPLHLAGEHEHPVPPLPVPRTGSEGAVELFVRRAQLVQPSFALGPDTADDVREICRRLDGLPLAIEIVAARVKLLGPRALRSRLDDTLGVPSGARDVPERQQSLRSALEWSHRLLPPHLQVAFQRLGALEGAFDLAAAGAVLGTGGDPFGVVADLVDVNLLSARQGADGEPRFRMLRTIALYARELLGQGDEADPAHRRHAEHFATFAETWSPQLRSAHHLARDRIEADLENLRAALAWSLRPAADGAPHSIDLGLRLCEQLSWFWYACGYQAEGLRWLQSAVDAAKGARTPEAMVAVHGLGVLVLQHGQAERARAMLEVCLAFWRDVGDMSSISRELNSLSLAYRALDEPRTSRRLVEEAVDTARRSGNRRREANAMSNLAALHMDAGDSAGAIGLLERVLELDTELGDAWGQAADHVNLAGAMLRSGDVDLAQDKLAQHAASAIALGDVDITVDVIGLLCAAHALRRDAGRAARLLGAMQTMRDQAELPLPPPDAAWLESVLAGVRDQPNAPSWGRNLAVGASYSVEDALADALGDEPSTAAT